MYTTNPNIEKVRVQAIPMVKKGKSTREVARHFGYAQSTIVKWCKRRHEIWYQQTVMHILKDLTEPFKKKCHDSIYLFTNRQVLRPI